MAVGALLEGPRAARPARAHARRRLDRLRPHAEVQLDRRARPLAAGHVDPAGGRRHPPRGRARLDRPVRRAARRRPGLAGGRRGDDLPLPGYRPRDRVPDEPRPTGAPPEGRPCDRRDLGLSASARRSPSCWSRTHAPMHASGQAPVGATSLASCDQAFAIGGHGRRRPVDRRPADPARRGAPQRLRAGVRGRRARRSRRRRGAPGGGARLELADARAALAGGPGARTSCTA